MKKQKGFSILESMVGMSFLVVSALALSSLSVSNVKNQKGVMNSYLEIGSLDATRQTMNRIESCSSMGLAGLTIEEGHMTSVPAISLGDGQTSFVSGQKDSEGWLRYMALTGVVLLGPHPDDPYDENTNPEGKNLYFSEFKVTSKNEDYQIGNSSRSESYFLNLVTDGDGVIENCYGLNESLSELQKFCETKLGGTWDSVEEKCTNVEVIPDIANRESCFRLGLSYHTARKKCMITPPTTPNTIAFETTIESRSSGSSLPPKQKSITCPPGFKVYSPQTSCENPCNGGQSSVRHLPDEDVPPQGSLEGATCTCAHHSCVTPDPVCTLQIRCYLPGSDGDPTLNP